MTPGRLGRSAGAQLLSKGNRTISCCQAPALSNASRERFRHHPSTSTMISSLLPDRYRRNIDCPYSLETHSVCDHRVNCRLKGQLSRRAPPPSGTRHSIKRADAKPGSKHTRHPRSDRTRNHQGPKTSTTMSTVLDDNLIRFGAPKCRYWRQTGTSYTSQRHLPLSPAGGELPWRWFPSPCWHYSARSAASS